MNRKGTQKKARRNCCNKYNMTDIELYRSRFAETNLAINNVRIKMVGRVCVCWSMCACVSNTNCQHIIITRLVISVSWLWNW